MAPIRFCELKNRFVKSGGQGKQVTLTEYDVNILNGVGKGDLPLIQLFDTDYRVSTQNVDWNLWNGCVYIDIDSKHYYNEVRQFDIDRLFDLLYEYLLVAYTFNFYCIQKSASGTSYHFWFYFKVEKSEDNFKKAEDIARNMVVEAFENVGAGEIIHYKVGDKAVLDNCTVSPFQGFHPSCYPFSFGNHSLLWFGEFDGWNQYEFERPVRVSDIKEDGTKMFELMEFKPIDKKIKLEHRSRLAVYMALKAVYGSFKETQVAWEYLCRNCIADGDKHKSIDYIKEGERWFRYNYPVNVNVLKKFGYKFNKAFEPRKIDFYKPDVVYELGEGQYLSNIQIKWSYEKINHLYAGCSLGKTHNAKSLGVKEIIDDIDWVFGKRNKRVCFISPMRSINKDGFEKEKRDEWIIVDSDHDTTNKEIYDSVHHALRNSELNVCVTWESYCAYQMYQIPFDYVIVDEVHTFFMYDYRVASITEMKRALERATGIRILMTGTPSAELKEFDCYKIQVKKKMTKVPAEIV
ncbi:MAG: DEAD/DEAH box helicase family protein, partial [Paludibacteraceae bacterium]|nr:DEAD/DEAH box helicase family protein [Paludibacteraceae bacterium]